MTEDDWLNRTDPQAMLDLLWGRASERKLRLFAVACCRRIWLCLLHQWSRAAVEAAEREADGRATREELQTAWVQAQMAWERARYPDDPELEEDNPFRTLAAVACDHLAAADAAASLVERPQTGVETAEGTWVHVRSVAALARQGSRDGEGPEERRQQAALLRDVFGSLPFRVVPLDLRWRAPAVIALARSMYEGRRFADMPLLGDALEEAGCTSPEILNPCRLPGVHAKGCWVLDLVLEQG